MPPETQSVGEGVVANAKGNVYWAETGGMTVRKFVKLQTMVFYCSPCVREMKIPFTLYPVRSIVIQYDMALYNMGQSLQLRQDEGLGHQRRRGDGTP